MIFDRIDGDNLHTWECGQGPMDPKAWGDGKRHLEAKRRIRPVKYTPIQSVLRLSAALPDFGWRYCDIPTGELFDAMEKPYTPEVKKT
jgi:hypothetical protein